MKQSKGDLWSQTQQLLKQRATGKHTVQIGHAGAVTIVQFAGDARQAAGARCTRHGHRLTACGVRGGR